MASADWPLSRKEKEVRVVNIFEWQLADSEARRLSLNSQLHRLQRQQQPPTLPPARSSTPARASTPGRAATPPQLAGTPPQRAVALSPRISPAFQASAQPPLLHAGPSGGFSPHGRSSAEGPSWPIFAVALLVLSLLVALYWQIPEVPESASNEEFWTSHALLPQDVMIMPTAPSTLLAVDMTGIDTSTDSYGNLMGAPISPTDVAGAEGLSAPFVDSYEDTMGEPTALTGVADAGAEGMSELFVFEETSGYSDISPSTGYTEISPSTGDDFAHSMGQGQPLHDLRAHLGDEMVEHPQVEAAPAVVPEQAVEEAEAASAMQISKEAAGLLMACGCALVSLLFYRRFLAPAPALDNPVDDNATNAAPVVGAGAGSAGGVDMSAAPALVVASGRRSSSPSRSSASNFHRAAAGQQQQRENEAVVSTIGPCGKVNVNQAEHQRQRKIWAKGSLEEVVERSTADSDAESVLHEVSNKPRRCRTSTPEPPQMYKARKMYLASSGKEERADPTPRPYAFKSSRLREEAEREVARVVASAADVEEAVVEEAVVSRRRESVVSRQSGRFRGRFLESPEW